MTVSTVAVVHVGSTAEKVQVETVEAIHRTAPVATPAACVVDCAIVGIPVTCRNKL